MEKRINYGFDLQTDNLKDLLLNITCQITIIHSMKKTFNICLEDCYCVRTSVVVQWSRYLLHNDLKSHLMVSPSKSNNIDQNM